jgi:negative regulator of flagellin synthesis FlgM
MEINPARLEANQDTQKSKRTSGDSAGSYATPTPARGLDDSVSVTDQAVKLRQLEQSLATIPEVDNPRVQAIKQAIADGSYAIDSEQLVNNLLRAEQDFS